MQVTIGGDCDIDDNGNGVMSGLCCVACREEIVAKFGVATPFRLYVGSVDCLECGEQLVKYDVLTGRVA